MVLHSQAMGQRLGPCLRCHGCSVYVCYIWVYNFLLKFHLHAFISIEENLTC